jgi:hypothetical protein
MKKTRSKKSRDTVPLSTECECNKMSCGVKAGDGGSLFLISIQGAAYQKVTKKKILY